MLEVQSLIDGIGDLAARAQDGAALTIGNCREGGTLATVIRPRDAGFHKRREVLGSEAELLVQTNVLWAVGEGEEPGLP